MNNDLESNKAPELNKDLDSALAEFMDAFCLVFHHDWDFSHNLMSEDLSSGSPLYIKNTFLNPLPGSSDYDEANNWANRGGLLSAYDKLVAVMQKTDIERNHPSGFLEDAAWRSPVSRKDL